MTHVQWTLIKNRSLYYARQIGIIELLYTNLANNERDLDKKNYASNKLEAICYNLRLNWELRSNKAFYSL